jgi:hypothetical protein
MSHPVHYFISCIKDKSYTHGTETTLLTGRAKNIYTITTPTQLGTTYAQHTYRCKNEFKHKDNTIEGRQPPSKNV